ncbi:MAG: MFS transporter [Armatimonadetes bacterium]|nr:MFS transporter [Armatimonadota bacterium]
MRLFVFARLAIMMFLQYAIWGAWTPVLSLYLEKQLNFTGAQTGFIYSLLWLACMVSPFLGGQLADRWVPAQWFLAAMHTIGGLALWKCAHAQTYASMWPWMLLYSLAFAPTLAITNSVAFKNLTNSERQFGAVRVFGTIGWIVAGVLLSAWRHGKLGLPPWPSQSDCLILGSVFSFIMAAWCVLLPHTPPSREAEPLAFLRALRMARDRRFLFFLVLSFIVATELQFYYVLTGPFLNDLGVNAASVPIVNTLAQDAEIFVMFIALPLLLPRLGYRRTLAIGVLAWPLRYLIWSIVAYIGQPVWLVIASLTLHGFCYVFFFTVSQVYVDTIAPKDIRHSAQALLTFATLGLGNYLGTHFTGFIQDLFTSRQVGPGGEIIAQTQWHLVFLVPIFVTVACAVAFLLWFQEPKPGEVIGAVEGETVGGAQTASASAGVTSSDTSQHDRPESTSS